jgi:uroporphyrinogen-III synthase
MGSSLGVAPSFGNLTVAAFGFAEKLLEAFEHSVVGSAGTKYTEALLANGIAVNLEPEHPRMSALVHEAAK